MMAEFSIRRLRSLSVTLRCEPRERRTSKGYGPRVSGRTSFEARKSAHLRV